MDGEDDQSTSSSRSASDEEGEERNESKEEENNDYEKPDKVPEEVEALVGLQNGKRALPLHLRTATEGIRRMRDK